MWLPVKVVDCYFKFQCTPTYKNIHCRGLQLWKVRQTAVFMSRNGCDCQIERCWYQLALIPVFSLPHPCTVTSSFLPNCPSLMDNCNNNYLCVYIFLHSLCFCCCQWWVSKEWQNHNWIISGAESGDKEISKWADAFGKRPQLSSS